MATTLEDVGDLFLAQVQDYKLDALYASSILNFNLLLESWLLMAIDEFGVCTQALVYNEDTQEFSLTLTTKNKLMLAKIMLKYWMRKELHNVLQMNNLLQDADFKTYSAASNVKEKRAMYEDLCAEIDHELNLYEYAGVDWDGWEIQDFR